MKNNLPLILLGLISLLAFLLRFYHLTLNPPHLYVDEAAISYDAYSVNLTGKDQWGDHDPFLFKSYGDYKLPLYIYSVVVSQKIFGFNEYAVRFPSALSGFLAVIGIYFMAKEIIFLAKDKFKNRNFERISSSFALLASLMFCISSWTLQFSRGGFEANVALLFRILGSTLFLRAVRKNIWLLPLSILCFISAMYTYHSAAITAPLVLLVLSVLFVKPLLANIKALVVAIILGLLVLAPYIPSYALSANGRVRFSSESVAHMPGNILTNFTNNYLGNFSFDYLFFKGDQQGRHSVKKLGELYLWQLPFVLAGIYFLLKYRSKASIIIILGILISNIPPAITRVSPHALRGLLAVRYWQLLIAVGLIFLLPKLKHKIKYLLIPVVVYALMLYLHIYYVHYPQAYALDWQDGHKETVEYVKTIEKNYDQIFVYNTFVPMYWFLYLPYDPVKLQQSGHNDREFWKISYVDLAKDPPKIHPEKKSLVITSNSYENNTYKLIKDIKMVNGDTAFRIYEF